MDKNKPKVSTKTRNSKEKIKDILKILGEHPEGLFPKHISLYTHINQNTTKSILEKLKNEGIIKKEKGIRGLYILVENSTHGIEQYNYHNAILTFKDDKITTTRQVKEVNDETELIQTIFIIGSTTNQATMHISSDYPFNTSSLSILGHLFQEKINRFCGFMPEINKVIVTTIELNKDYNYCRLEGIKSITLGNLIAEFKLYNKKNCVREEIKTKIPINLELITKLLNQGLTSAEFNLRISKTEEEIQQIKKGVEKLPWLTIKKLKKLKIEGNNA